MAKTKKPAKKSTAQKTLEIFKKTKAFLEGHFLLSSGLHSSKYVQCAIVLQYPTYAAYLAKNLASKFNSKKIDVVVSPAIGGIVIGQEVGRALGKRSIFAERQEGQLTLRRGFDLKKGEQVLVVEDVLTTGGSVKEIIKIVNKVGAKLAGVGCMIDRTSKKLNFKVPMNSLMKLEIKTYSSDECPMCKDGKIPLVKPGSKTKK